MSNMPHTDLINKFYKSFSEGDAAGMTACYHDSIVFEDPAFGILHGEKAKSMWHMLLSKSSSNLTVTWSGVTTDNNKGSAQWIGEYYYGPKKRKVINRITAEFKFKDGKIVEHKDYFDLWLWSRQALGLSGYLLGWSSFMKKKINTTTNSLLDKYIKEKQAG